MSKHLKKKSVLLFVTQILSLIVLGIFLFNMQTNLAVRNQKMDTQRKLEQMGELIASADAEAAQATASYDEVYQSKAESIAYMVRKQVDPEYDDATLASYAEMMNISNILIIDREGNVIAAGQKSPADFTYERFNQLKTVFRTGEPSEPFNVQTGDKLYRYFGAKIDDNTMAVIEHDPEELTELLDSTSSWKSILGNVSVGLEGYAFAVSSQDYTFLYHPDKELIGEDALDAGIDVEQLEDKNYTWLTVNGQRLYSGVTFVDADNAYIICAVTEDEIAASRNITVGIILFVFFAVMTLVITYAIFMMMDEERTGNIKEEEYRRVGSLYYNTYIGRKIRIITLIGLICILAISFYMQTLFSLSRHAMSNSQHTMEAEHTINRNMENVELIKSQYNRRYLNKGQVAAYILTQKPELRTKPDLKELSEVLGVEQTSVFDSTGVLTATSSPRTNFRISDNPEEQSYDFQVLLIGEEYLIQDAQIDQVSHTYKQYIGVSLRDEQDNTAGFVQIRITPSKLEEVLASTEISHVLDGIKVGTNGFAFSVNKEDGTFSYFPDENLIGKPVLEYGMKESQLRHGYSDYIKIDNKRYFAASLETDDNLIYVATPDDELSDTRIPVTLAATGASLICLLIIFLLLTFDMNPQSFLPAPDSGEKKENGIIHVMMPDGTLRRSSSAVSRWSNTSIPWRDMTPDQRFMVVMKLLSGILAVGITLAVIFKDRFFDEESIFNYVISGQWERGVNVFALTSCIMIICVVCIASMLVRWILGALSRALNARGETMCRLASSFIKYACLIAILYYCLALLGVDTATLVASAGILTLVVGLGANKLVSDIVAGLFIIFEGEFRVGDIVTIGDCRGTVMDIGIRTTKIEDGNGNVKIISNSAVSGVVNMTRQYSFAASELNIAYTGDPDELQKIFESEFASLRQHLPAIVDGPYYQGIIALGAASVKIRITVQCIEHNRMQLERDLNREMKLILDKHNLTLA